MTTLLGHFSSAEPCIMENDLDPQESAVVAIICFAVIIPIVIIIVIVAGILFIVYNQRKKQNRGKRGTLNTFRL